jgi:hypothetical protein
MQFLEQQYMQMVNQDMMASQFEQMMIRDQPQMMAQPTNYFQHIQERPNMQNEMNSIWDSTTAEPMAQQTQ